MDKKSITCCFTGHRPQKLPWRQNENDPRCLALKEELEARLEGIYLSGCSRFLCGMAIGCDMYFAEAVLKLKERFPEVTLEAYVPCADQPAKWHLADKRRYEDLLSRCDRVNVLQEHYSADCMQRRNRRMVDESAVLLACYDGYPGGTMTTILYAERNGVKVIMIEI